MTENSAIYCRVSTKAQNDEGYSLAEQARICAEYNLAKVYNVVDQVYEVISGATYDRPKMGELLELAKRKQIQVVTCMELDRFARGPAPMMIMEEQLKGFGVRVEYVFNQFENTPAGDMMKTIHASVGQFEREQIRLRSMRGKASKARSGKIVNGGIPLFGYDLVDDQYVIREDEAVYVRMVFNWYVNEGLGYIVIANKLSEMGVLTRSDKLGIARRSKKPGVWSAGTISDMLHNRTYAGTYTWGKTQTVRGKKVQRDASPDNHIYVSVPEIVSCDLFEAAQRKMEYNVTFSKRNQKHDYLLAGHLVCPTCGYHYLGLSTSPKPGSTKKNYYYRCGSKSSANNPYPGYKSPCSSKYLRANDLDEYVWELIAEVLRNPKLITEALEDENNSSTSDQNHGAVLQKELQKLNNQQERLLNLYLENAMDNALLKSKAEEIKRAQASIQREIDNIEQQEQKKLTKKDKEDIGRFCLEASDKIDLLTFTEKRGILRLLQVRVIVDRLTAPFSIEI